MPNHKTVREQANDEARAMATVIEGYARRLDDACEVAYAHVGDAKTPRQFQWVVDQMIRKMQGDKYDQWIKDATNDGAEEWDTGTAP